MAIWFGGVRLPPDKTLTYIDPESGSFAKFEPRNDNTFVLTLRVYGCGGQPALGETRTLRPGDDFQETDDGAVLSIKPMPMPQPTQPQAASGDLLVALVAFDNEGHPVFEFGHDGMRTHRPLRVQVG